MEFCRVCVVYAAVEGVGYCHGGVGDDSFYACRFFVSSYSMLEKLEKLYTGRKPLSVNPPFPSQR